MAEEHGWTLMNGKINRWLNFSRDRFIKKINNGVLLIIVYYCSSDSFPIGGWQSEQIRVVFDEPSRKSGWVLLVLTFAGEFESPHQTRNSVECESRSYDGWNKLACMFSPNDFISIRYLKKTRFNLKRTNIEENGDGIGRSFNESAQFLSARLVVDQWRSVTRWSSSLSFTFTPFVFLGNVHRSSMCSQGNDADRGRFPGRFWHDVPVWYLQ